LVAGTGVEAVSAAVFVVVLFVAPLFFVTFLCVFFVVFVPVEVGASVVVEDFWIVAPVAGFVVVVGPVCVVVVLLGSTRDGCDGGCRRALRRDDLTAP
jgi:hypothetical protein